MFRINFDDYPYEALANLMDTAYDNHIYDLAEAIRNYLTEKQYL